MLNRNEVWAGLIIGLVMPTLGFVILYEIFQLLEIKGAASSEGFSPMFRERTLSIVSIALNLIPLNMFRKRRWDKAMRGIVIGTVILVGVWVFYFGSIIIK